MNKNAICVLANNMELFGNMIKNLPDDFSNNYDLIVINETRIGNKIDEIKALTYHVSNCIIIDSMTIINKFKKEIIDNSFVDSYTMGMNILMQWYVFKTFMYDKILFLDDDIIITDNVKHIFELNESSFYIFTLSVGANEYLKNSKNMKLCIDTFADIFDIEINENTYRQNWINTHVNGGHRLYCKQDFNMNLYQHYLYKFYINENIQYLWNIRTQATSYYLDERFEGFFAVATHIINSNLNKLVCLEFRSPEKVNFDKYNVFEKKAVWHIVARTRKIDWINKLKEKQIIK